MKDAELIRRAVVPPTSSSGGRWSILGQSFGGFCWWVRKHASHDNVGWCSWLAGSALVCRLHILCYPLLPLCGLFAVPPRGAALPVSGIREHGFDSLPGAAHAHTSIHCVYPLHPCSATYLSLAPEGLVEALITGGLPPGINQPCSAEDGAWRRAPKLRLLPKLCLQLEVSACTCCQLRFTVTPTPPRHPAVALAVYRRTFRRCLQQNAKFYQRFPMDVEAAQVCDHTQLGVIINTWFGAGSGIARQGLGLGALHGLRCSESSLPPHAYAAHRAAPYGKAGCRSTTCSSSVK